MIPQRLILKLQDVILAKVLAPSEAVDKKKSGKVSHRDCSEMLPGKRESLFTSFNFYWYREVMFFYYIDYMYTRYQNQCQAGVHKLVTMFKKFVLLKFNITVLPLLLPCSTKFNLQFVNLFFLQSTQKISSRTSPKKWKQKQKQTNKCQKNLLHPNAGTKKGNNSN